MKYVILCLCLLGAVPLLSVAGAPRSEGKSTVPVSDPPLALAAGTISTDMMTAERFSRLPINKQLQLFGKLPFYQQIKIWATSIFNLTTDAIHIYIGFIVLMLTVILTGKPDSFNSLIPGIGVSTLMEIFDLYNDYAALGFFRWMASAHDMVNTNVIPFVVVILFRLFWHSETRRPAKLPILSSGGAISQVVRRYRFGERSSSSQAPLSESQSTSQPK